MTLFSKSYISYGVKVFVCCVYLLKSRSVVGTSISSTQKVLIVLLPMIEYYTQVLLQVKFEFIVFPSIFFCIVQRNGHCVR